MRTHPTRPLVAVVGQGGEEAGVGFDAFGIPYARSLIDLAEVLPVLVPRALPIESLGEWIERIDGLLLTGDSSNIEPWRYGTAVEKGRGPYDTQRDALALALVVEARRRGIPLLGICRGCEEINVAYGGTLWTALHEEGFRDHREPDSPDPRVRYRPAHEVALEADGWLNRMAEEDTWTVNSLHGQGIRSLGPGLVSEAHSPDGLIEAVRDAEPRRWILGVQWHPEWESHEDRLARELFASFGQACASFTHASQRASRHADARGSRA